MEQNERLYAAYGYLLDLFTYEDREGYTVYVGHTGALLRGEWRGRFGEDIEESLNLSGYDVSRIGEAIDRALLSEMEKAF